MNFIKQSTSQDKKSTAYNKRRKNSLILIFNKNIKFKIMSTCNLRRKGQFLLTNM